MVSIVLRKVVKEMADITEISICIPVWNVESYITQCLESVFHQTIIDKTEIIIIDDCTPDNSISIIKKLLEKYPQHKNRLRIIKHEKNRGLAAARNTGLKNAIGKYIIQVDSDDWLEPDYIERLYKAIESENADIAGCDYFLELADKTKIIKEDLNKSPINCLKYMITICQGIIWTKLVRKELYIKNNISWVEGLDMGEDLLICSKLFANANKVVNVNKPLYHYRKTNPNSFCNDAKKNQYKFESLVKVTNSVIEYLSKWSPLYDNEFRLMKAKIKQISLFMGDRSLRKQVYELWPECNNSLLCCADSFRMKILLFFVSHKLYFFSEFLFMLKKR